MAVKLVYYKHFVINQEKTSLETVNFSHESSRRLSSVPGKPPSKINATATSSSSIRVTWSPVSSNEHFVLWGYRLVYWSSEYGSSYSLVLYKNLTEVDLDGLSSAINYSIHVMSITSRGFGIASRSVTLKILPEGNRFLCVRVRDKY